MALAVGIAVIGYFSYQSYLYFEKRELQVGQVAFDKAYAITKEKLNSYVYGLQGMGGVYLTRNFAISPVETREYARFGHFFKNFPGTLGFGFIRYIPEEKMSEYKRELKQKMPELVITRLTEQSFGDYMVIESIEPIERNRAALGLDVGSEPNRRSAAVVAMETGEATLTHRIQLMQSDHLEAGFLFYLPLYKTHTVPRTTAERRKEIQGWSYAPILASEIGNHLRDSFDPGLEFAIDEDGGAQGAQRIFGTLQGQEQTYSRAITIGGSNWILRANYRAHSFSSYRWVLPLMGFVIFAALNVFVSIYLRNLILTGLETEKRAQSIEDQMEILINGASFAIIAVDPSGVITTVNKAALAMLGYSRDELLCGVSPEMLHDPEEIRARAQTLSLELGVPVSPDFDVFVAKAKAKNVDIHEWTYIRKDQSRFPVRLVVTPVFSDDNELEGFMGIAEDITELVNMRKTIDSQQQQMIASAKLSSLGEMAGGIAHEINNPLAIIISKIKLLEQKISRHEIDWNVLKSELGKIDQTTLRIAKIVRGLKAFSRESTQDLKERVRISSILNDVLDLCGEKFKYHEVDLRLKEYEDVELICRSTQISQVLVNLLGNSFDAIQQNDEKWVEIEIVRYDHILRISVTDSGRGIPESVAQKIMHPFFTTKEVGKGTGLGLSISKGLIEDHGGKIFLDTSCQNTRFVIDLPLS